MTEYKLVITATKLHRVERTFTNLREALFESGVEWSHAKTICSLPFISLTRRVKRIKNPDMLGKYKTETYNFNTQRFH